MYVEYCNGALSSFTLVLHGVGRHELSMHLAPSSTAVGSRIRPVPDENGEITNPNDQCLR